MKKKLIYFFIGLCILFAVVYFLRYKQALIFNNKVPINATQVANIDLRQIEHHIFFDFLANPMSYIDLKSSKKEKDSLSFLDAIAIPKNLIFYTNEANLNGSWFSSVIRIKDSKELIEFLNREQFKKSNVETLTIYRRNNIALAIDNKQLVIAFNFTKKERLPDFQTVFNTTDFLPETAKLLEPIINSKSDISYASLTEDFIEVNFKDGLFEVMGIYKSDFFIAEKHQQFSDTSIGLITAKINKNHKLFNSLLADKNIPKFKKATKLSLDSISKKWNGNIDFHLRSINTKKDTIVTYDYDDDFNKIEKVTTQNTVVPDFEFVLESEKDRTLYNYFLEKNAIQFVENDTLFTSIPFYKLYARFKDSQVYILTDNDLNSKNNIENLHKIDAYFNIEQYVQNQLEIINIPLNNKYVKLFKDASIHLSDTDKLSIEVHFKNDKRNIIGQLVNPLINKI